MKWEQCFSSIDADGLLCQALLTGNFEAAVDMCLCENKMAEAILLAIAGGPELLRRTQQRYFQKNSTNLGRVGSVATYMVDCALYSGNILKASDYL